MAPQGRVADPENQTHTFQWLLQETYDAHGNYSVYEYASEDSTSIKNSGNELNRSQTANRFLKRIKYGNDTVLSRSQWNQLEKIKYGSSTALKDADWEAAANQQGIPQFNWHFEVVFDYGDHAVDTDGVIAYEAQALPESSLRQDAFSSYQAGFEIRTSRLCRNIMMFHRFAELDADPILTHVTRLEYQASPRLSLLKTIESVGYRRDYGHYTQSKLPPLTLDYVPFELKTGSFETFQTSDNQSIPQVRSNNYQLIDLYGEGLPGVLYQQDSTTYYWEPVQLSGKDPSQSGAEVTYSAGGSISQFPIHRDLAAPNQQLMDLTGNGQLDLVVNSVANTGYYQVQPDRSWDNLQSLPAVPNEFHAPGSQFLDVSGDGLTDLVRFEQDQIQIYPSLGAAGFGPANSQIRSTDLPLPSTPDAQVTIRFADIFGTGGSHLVHISSGQVKCWPHLGYGRFGKPVHLENAPHFPANFDAERLFLVDIDSSGTPDLVYVDNDQVEIWFNQSGNSFSKESVKLSLPATCSHPQQISFADRLGTGTVSVIFSADQIDNRHWYLDINEGQKPHLLNQVSNNLGASSTISYASSTRFYLEDKQAGRPWLTQLPFPVQVIEKVTLHEQFSGTKLVQTYRYRHGAYDGIEREFRGFGYVERRDAETLPINAQKTDVPPVVTKTWYHTGMQLNESQTERLQQEYYDGDRLATQLGQAELIDELGFATTKSIRQMHRALHGQTLRTEVFSENETGALSADPLTVQEAAFRVTQVESASPDRAPILFPQTIETINYQYECDPDDPRVSHHFILKTDMYGQVLHACDVFYPRRTHTEAFPEQQQLQAIATQNTFLNLEERYTTGENRYLIGIPSEERHFEVADLKPQNKSNTLTYAQVEQAVQEAISQQDTFDDVGYHPIVATARQGKLLAVKQYFYWNEARNHEIMLGMPLDQPLALLHHSEELVFSADFHADLGSVYPADTNSYGMLKPTLLEDAGYIKRDLIIGAAHGSGPGYPFKTHWWKPGATTYYQGSNIYNLPIKTVDPFKASTDIAYDKYQLLAVHWRDPLNNTTTAEIDYQALRPARVIDSNQNVSEVLFDPLGRVTASTHYGSLNKNGKVIIHYRCQP